MLQCQCKAWKSETWHTHILNPAGLKTWWNWFELANWSQYSNDILTSSVYGSILTDCHYDCYQALLISVASSLAMSYCEHHRITCMKGWSQRYLKFYKKPFFATISLFSSQCSVKMCNFMKQIPSSTGWEVIFTYV